MRVSEKLKLPITEDILSDFFRETDDEYDPELVSDFLFMTDEQLEVKYDVFDIFENLDFDEDVDFNELKNEYFKLPISFAQVNPLTDR